MNLILFDMSTVAFRRTGEDGSLLWMSLPGLDDALRIPLPDATSDREAVFIGLDRALGELKVPLHGTWLSIGLYNPLTAQVAVGAVPATETFSDGEPLPLDLYGTVADLHDGILTVDARELTPLVPDLGGVRASLAAHRNSYAV